MGERRLADLPYIDIHTHGSGGASHVAIHSAGLDELETALDRYPRLSVGLHPWFIAETDVDATLERVERLASHPAVWAIGECGLDRMIATPQEEQERVLVRQIRMAEAVAKPLILHCVRAHNELLRIFKSMRPRTPAIVHGYNNRPQIADQLLRRGLWLSFGKALLTAESPARKVVADCPADRYFLESDDSDIPIETIYQAAAECRGQDVDVVQRQLRENLCRMFPLRT